MTQPLTNIAQQRTMGSGVGQYERRSMDERELVSFLRERGWTLHKLKRNRGVQYLYAARREGTKVKERYIAPLSRLSELTEDFILEKLQDNEPNGGAATECLKMLGRLSHSVA